MFLSPVKHERIREGIDFILSRLLIIFFFCLLIVYASREIADLDIWLHLKTGQYILQNHTIPSIDIFSFTMTGSPWINHEWLFQVFTQLFYLYAGADGLILMQNIVLITVFLLLFFSALKNNNYIFIFVILYLALLSSAYRFTIRPDIFSLLFLTIYLCVLKKSVENSSPLVWMLPIYQVLWVNMHGFAFTGPLIIFIVLASELAKRAFKLPASWNQTRRLEDKQVKQLLLILGLVILAFFINPYGLKGAAYPLSVLGQISGKGKIVFHYIQELAKPITFKNILDTNNFIFYKIFILVSCFSFRFNFRNINLSDLLLWLFFLGFSFIAIRNVAYFAIIAAYVIFNNVSLALENKKAFPEIFQKKTVRVIFGYCCMAALFLYPAQGAGKYLDTASYNFDNYELKSSMWGVAENRYPSKAVDFLLKYNFPKRMLNDFNSGSYLIGRAFPNRQVFIDGRTELYGPDFFTEYVSLGEGKKGTIEKVLKKYDINGFFLTISTDDLHTGLMRYLLHSKEWKLVYFDGYAIILLKNTVQNSALINKFAIDLNKWNPPEPDYLKIGINFRYPLPYMARARLLNKCGFIEAASREADVILNLIPNNSEALHFMSDYYFEHQDFKKAYIYARNCLLFSPGDLAMRTRLALIYKNLKVEEKALKIIDAIIKKKPTNDEGYYTKAIIVKDKDRKKAIELLKKAIKLAPKQPRNHELMGDLLSGTGDRQGAKIEWKKAFEYDASNGGLKKKLEIY